MKAKGLTVALVFSILFALIPGWGHAQVQAIEVVIDKVDGRDFPHVRLVSTPVDGFGVPIPSLLVGNFEIREGDQKVDTLQLTDSGPNPDVEISVCLALDVSGSMKGAALTSLKDAATGFLDGLNVADRVALVSVSREIEFGDPVAPAIDPARESAFSDDKEHVKNIIQGLEAGGSTPLYDAFLKCVRMAAGEGRGNRAILIMTDGRDERLLADGTVVPDGGSTIARSDDPINEAKSNGIPVFTIGLGRNIDESYLRRAATLTGGTHAQTPDPTQLADLFQHVADRLKYQYTLEYQSAMFPDGENQEITLLVGTPAGDGQNTASVTRHPPVVPAFVRVNVLVRPKDEPKRLEIVESVRGRVKIQPIISVRSDLVKVEYYVDDLLVGTAEEAPWEFLWNSRGHEAGMEHQLKLVAYDDTDPPNVGEQQFAVLVEPCNIVCAFQSWATHTPGERLALTIGAIALLLITAIALIVWWLKGRRPAPGEQVVYVPEPATQIPTWSRPESAATPVPDSSRATAHGEVLPTAPITTAPSGGPHSGPEPTPSLRTEALFATPPTIAFLIMEKGPSIGKEFRLGEATTIGRTVRNDIILDDTAVSRSHAKIRLQDKQFSIQDLATENGTRVNGQKIVRHELQDGDRVEIGRIVLVFKQLD